MSCFEVLCFLKTIFFDSYEYLLLQKVLVQESVGVFHLNKTFRILHYPFDLQEINFQKLKSEGYIVFHHICHATWHIIFPMARTFLLGEFFLKLQ